MARLKPFKEQRKVKSLPSVPMIVAGFSLWFGDRCRFVVAVLQQKSGNDQR
jgi:hypothetical protein